MDETQREWLAGDGDYKWAARQRAADTPVAPPDEAPDRLPSRDALLGDLGGGPSLDMLERFGRTRHAEDDNPPGVPWHRSAR